MLSMDEEFVGRFRGSPLQAQARVLHGLQTFGVGLLEGITGELPPSLPSQNILHPPNYCHYMARKNKRSIALFSSETWS
jgi:hypothetical protein